MSDGFLAFKGLAWGGGALVLAAMILPSATNNHFDPLRALKMPGSSEGIGDKMSGKPKRTPAPTPTPTLPHTPTPTPTTTPTPTSTGSGYAELSMIPSNFDFRSELARTSVPPSAAPDVVGAFRFLCGPGQVAKDDPIAYPNQPGVSHLHQFYGNTSANASSTYASLRQRGDSTCMSPVNRSAYWMPAMLDGKGNVVRPDYVAIYYKRRPASDPMVSDPNSPQYEGKGIPLPNGLRFIFGFNMLNPAQVPTGEAYFNCDGATGTQGHYADLPTAFAHCPAGNRVGAIIQAPECWDGVNLDSADHRSHVAYPSYGSWGYLKCPSGYPYVLPHFQLGAWYSIVAGDDTSKWHFASDEMFPGHPAGYTFHADFFDAWDNNVEAMWTDNCINKMLNCSGGNLGNGYNMKMYSGFRWTANPRLVPIPS